MKVTVIYSKRTCKTGRALFDYLKQHPSFSVVRRVRKDKRILTSDITIGWGNSTSHFPTSKLVINPPNAIRNASNKKTMMKMLIDNNIKTPSVTFNLNDNLDEFKDSDGYFYVRGHNHKVRYDNQVLPADLYVSKPVGNKREFRVHIYKDKILGIYEKKPNDKNIKLFKQENCHFSRLKDDTILISNEAKEMCIKAVKVLGLTCGGVDLMKVGKDFFVNEVNSSPSLSSKNIERYINAILEDYNKPIKTNEEKIKDRLNKIGGAGG